MSCHTVLHKPGPCARSCGMWQQSPGIGAGFLLTILHFGDISQKYKCGHYKICVLLSIRWKGSGALLNDFGRFQSKQINNESFPPLKHIGYQERSVIGNRWKHNFRNKVPLVYSHSFCQLSFSSEVYRLRASALLFTGYSCKLKSMTKKKKKVCYQLKPEFVPVDNKIQTYKFNAEHLS